MVITGSMQKSLRVNGSLVVGVGSALIDILAHENDEFLKQAGATKGGMRYVDKDFIEHTVGLATLTPVVVPGGSACNTLVGIGRLGGNARFVGKCGNGPMGQLFRSDLKRRNVDPVLFDSAAPTGRVLSIITPDAQRSMLTYLGASADIRPEEIKPECFQSAAVVHVEGYLLFNRDVITAILETAKSAGAVISLDLASFNVVAESADILPDLVADHVDILIANEDEAMAYTRADSEEQALEWMAKDTAVAVVKLGARGSLIAQNGNRFTIPAYGGKAAVDTTGAGDLWAAGFLFGLVQGHPLERCGMLGSQLGYEVCQVVGADIPDERWNEIRKGLTPK